MDVSSSNVATGSTNREIQALPITLSATHPVGYIYRKNYNGVSYDPIESGGQEFMVLGRATINGLRRATGPTILTVFRVRSNCRTRARHAGADADMIDEVA